MVPSREQGNLRRRKHLAVSGIISTLAGALCIAYVTGVATQSFHLGSMTFVGLCFIGFATWTLTVLGGGEIDD